MVVIECRSCQCQQTEVHSRVQVTKPPLFFLLETGRCARGCIGDGAWYAAMSTKAHQSACRRCAGDTRFFKHGPNLSHLVLAADAKSHQTTTASLLDGTKDSLLCLSIGHDLLIDLEVFECMTVTDTHLATATGVWKDIMGVSDRQKTATQIKGFIANGKHCVLANFDARLPTLDSDHQNRYPRTQGCHLFCVV
jgi:hypothetical protein